MTPLCVDGGGLDQLDLVDLVWVKVIGFILETLKLTSWHAGLVLNWCGLKTSVSKANSFLFFCMYECPGALGCPLLGRRDAGLSCEKRECGEGQS